jgi:TetR/AcrR family transcriptional repressor of bet genes
MVAAWVAIGAEAQRNDEVRGLFATVIKARVEALRELFRAVLLEAHADTRHARAMAAVTLSAIEGAYRLAASAPDALPKGFAAPAVRRMVAGLIATGRSE